jgi:Bacterial TniB protein
MSHLNATTLPLLELSDEERIAKIRSPRWIGYSRSKEILDKLEDLLSRPKSHRMDNLLIVGDTNNGKTALINRFCARYPVQENPQGDHTIAPVLLIQAPPVPDEGRFYNAILDSIFAPYKPNDRVDKKQMQTLKILKTIDLRMLIIDEIHHILAGNLNKQRAFLNVIKFMGNELQIPIVGVGTNEAYRAIQTDAQLSNRFEPATLPRWQLDKEFLRLLVSFERMLPLKNPSNLQETGLAAKLFSLSEGYIGELSRLLTAASVQAILSGAERIDLKILSSVKWISPSDRKRQLDRGI